MIRMQGARRRNRTLRSLKTPPLTLTRATWTAARATLSRQVSQSIALSSFNELELLHSPKLCLLTRPLGSADVDSPATKKKAKGGAGTKKSTGQVKRPTGASAGKRAVPAPNQLTKGSKGANARAPPAAASKGKASKGAPASKPGAPPNPPVVSAGAAISKPAVASVGSLATKPSIRLPAARLQPPRPVLQPSDVGSGSAPRLPRPVPQPVQKLSPKAPPPKPLLALKPMASGTGGALKMLQGGRGCPHFLRAFSVDIPPQLKRAYNCLPFFLSCAAGVVRVSGLRRKAPISKDP
jgi:hypothetical protein